MPFPCCMKLQDGIQIVNLISLIFSVLVILASGWVWNETYQKQSTAEFKLAVEFWEKQFRAEAGTMYEDYTFTEAQLEKTAKYHPVKIVGRRIIFSAAVLTAAIVQFCSGVLFVVTSLYKVDKRRLVAATYISMKFIAWVVIGVIIGGLVTQEMGKLTPLIPFITATTLDFLFLIYLLVVALYYFLS